MNIFEKQMIKALLDLKGNHGVIGVKAEFGAEGTGHDEALKLKEIVAEAGLDITIKIGGCEAIKDLREAFSIGASQIVAPMIESPYALKKYIESINSVSNEFNDVKFLFNLETIYGYNYFDEMLPMLESLDGVVFGRADMVGSLGLSKDNVNSPQIFDYAKNIATKTKKLNKKFILGGGVSTHSAAFLRKFPSMMLDCFETRKVIFSAPLALAANLEDGILKAIDFELMWLKYKESLGNFYAEDEKRINILKKLHDQVNVYS